MKLLWVLPGISCQLAQALEVSCWNWHTLLLRTATTIPAINTVWKTFVSVLKTRLLLGWLRCFQASNHRRLVWLCSIYEAAADYWTCTWYTQGCESVGTLSFKLFFMKSRILLAISRVNSGCVCSISWTYCFNFFHTLSKMTGWSILESFQKQRWIS